MAVTPASIKAYAPQFATLSDSQVQAEIDYGTAAGPSADTFGDLYDQALTQYVCHMLTISQPNLVGAAGPVTQQSAGPVMEQFAAPAARSGASTFDRSTYGLRYLQLCRLMTGGVGTV